MLQPHSIPRSVVKITVSSPVSTPNAWHKKLQTPATVMSGQKMRQGKNLCLIVHTYFTEHSPESDFQSIYIIVNTFSVLERTSTILPVSAQGLALKGGFPWTTKKTLFHVNNHLVFMDTFCKNINCVKLLVLLQLEQLHLRAIFCNNVNLNTVPRVNVSLGSRGEGIFDQLNSFLHTVLSYAVSFALVGT